jgi:hypothetical protein
MSAASPRRRIAASTHRRIAAEPISFYAPVAPLMQWIYLLIHGDERAAPSIRFSRSDSLPARSARKRSLRSGG